MLFLWLVVMQLAIFGALVYVLRVVLTRNINKATSHLHQLNEDYTVKLEDAKKRQIESEKYYDQTVLRTKSDAEKTKVQILKEAHTQEEQILKDSRRKAEEIVEQANRTAEAIVREMEVLVSQKSVDKAGELLQDMLPHEISPAIHAAWTEAALKDGLGQLERLHLSDDVQTAEVVSAAPLTADQKALIEKKIRARLKKDIRIEEKTDPSLMAGFQVKLGSVVVDGTLRFKMKESIKHAKHNHAG